MENIAIEIDERQETLAFPSPSPAGRRARDEGPNQPPKTNHQSPVIGLTAEEAMATEQPEEFESGLETDLDAGWFFVLEERPGDVRFGADVADDVPLENWDYLNWQHFVEVDDKISNIDDLTFIDIDKHSLSSGEDPIWGKNAANMAHILYQPHNRVAIHADQMIK